MPGWSLPGYDVEHLLGGGSAGEVWLARERSTLEAVAVRVVTVDSPDDIDRLRREAVQVAAVRHPHLLRVRSVLPVDGGVALVSDFAAGGSLAALLEVRSALVFGEVLTIGAPMAAALAAIHAQGRVHGGLRTTNVLFTPDGRPLLADLGLSMRPNRADGIAPADDVLALAQVLGLALDRDAPAQLRACVERAMAADPAARPSAEEFAGELRGSGRPLPVRLDGVAGAGPTPPAERAAPGGRTMRTAPPVVPPPVPASRRSLPLIVGVPLALVAAVLVGRTWAATDRASGPAPLPILRSAAPSAPVATADWKALLTGLDAHRDAALANLDAPALAGVYAAGSAALARDLESIRSLTAVGARPDGLRLELESVRLVRRTPSRVTLRVVDRLPAYDLVSAAGRVLERRPGRGPAAWTVDLVPAGDGWRIAAVYRA